MSMNQNYSNLRSPRKILRWKSADESLRIKIDCKKVRKSVKKINDWGKKEEPSNALLALINERLCTKNRQQTSHLSVQRALLHRVHF